MTNLSFDYHNLHTQLTPEENAKRLEIVAEIIKTNQQRSVGITHENTDNNVRNKWYRLRYGGCGYSLDGLRIGTK